MVKTIRTLEELGMNKVITSSSGIRKLEKLRLDWSKAPIFYDTNDVEVAKRIVDITLCHTYLFGSITVPSYGRHIFGSITTPQNDIEGRVLASSLRFITEEICTDNVFEEEGETHAHYFDLRKAYSQVHGNFDAPDQFMNAVAKIGFDQAVQQSELWDDQMIAYAKTLKEVTKDPLATFLITAVSEDSIPEGYKTILRNLNSDNRFDYFRTFMKRHIILDQQRDGHGSVTVDWINHYVGSHTLTEANISAAVEMTVDFIDKRLETYR
ncbi:DUF3050 domain-containing protein [archaeon]|nr:DUF3050 domain-containing protein [archaeon]